ncbi:hypothetical protein A2U01_0058598, partial [Trifolium medium]|nr:hypothetical protein [Trifolium medium]
MEATPKPLKTSRSAPKHHTRRKTPTASPTLPPRDQLAGAETNIQEKHDHEPRNTATWTPSEARQQPLKGRHRQKGTNLDTTAKTVGINRRKSWWCGWPSQ